MNNTGKLSNSIEAVKVEIKLQMKMLVASTEAQGMINTSHSQTLQEEN